MIIFKTSLPKGKVYGLEPVLVDERKMVITDTMYGTGLPTYDKCEFLYYKDFRSYRKKKIKLHHWYQYDTLYHFKEGSYIVKFSFCKYRDAELYLRFIDPYSRATTYHYIKIPVNFRIHLHDYSSQLFERRSDEIKNAVRNSVLVMDCEKWEFKRQDCKE